MSLGFRVEFRGRAATIVSIELADGTNPTAEFLDALEPGDRTKIDTLFERMGTEGRILNREKFKKVEGSDGIFEFKSFQIRILCFWGKGRVLYLLYGLSKKSDKLKEAEVKRAEDYRTWARSQLGE